MRLLDGSRVHSGAVNYAIWPENNKSNKTKMQPLLLDRFACPAVHSLSTVRPSIRLSVAHAHRMTSNKIKRVLQLSLWQLQLQLLSLLLLLLLFPT